MHPVDPVVAYRELLVASLTTSPDQVLLTVTKRSRHTMVTTDLLAKALTVMLNSLQLGCFMYTLHSLRREGATTAYSVGINQLHIKMRWLVGQRCLPELHNSLLYG